MCVWNPRQSKNETPNEETLDSKHRTSLCLKFDLCDNRVAVGIKCWSCVCFPVIRYWKWQVDGRAETENTHINISILSWTITSSDWSWNWIGSCWKQPGNRSSFRRWFVLIRSEAHGATWVARMFIKLSFSHKTFCVLCCWVRVHWTWRSLVDWTANSRSVGHLKSLQCLSHLTWIKCYSYLTYLCSSIFLIFWKSPIVCLAVWKFN